MNYFCQNNTPFCKHRFDERELVTEHPGRHSHIKDDGHTRRTFWALQKGGLGTSYGVQQQELSRYVLGIESNNKSYLKIK